MPCDGFQQGPERRARADHREFGLDLFLEKLAEGSVLQAMRHPVELAMQLLGFEEFFREEQPEQVVPEEIFPVITRPSVPPQNACDACLDSRGASHPPPRCSL